MILGANGQPVSSQDSLGGGRKGNQVDVFSLPDGAIVSKERSFALHNKIKNNSVLRERIEAAQRQTGAKVLHLSMMQRGEMAPDTQRALIKHTEHGEKIMQKRIVDENLQRSVR